MNFNFFPDRNAMKFLQMKCNPTNKKVSPERKGSPLLEDCDGRKYWSHLNTPIEIFTLTLAIAIYCVFATTLVSIALGH